MISGLPSLHSLAAFESAARLHSFAKAGQELCVTPSAISHRIKLLEQHYGVRFFLRHNGSLLLTDQGKIFLDSVLDALSTLRTVSTRLRQDPARRIKINVSHSFANKWLVNKLDDYYRTHKDIDLEIRAVTVTSLNRLTDLKSGEVDIAIRYGKSNDWRGFNEIKLMSVELFPVCSSDYISKVGSLRKPEDLLHTTLLRSTREPWGRWFEAAGVKSEGPLHGTVFSDAGLLLSAAVSGQGVALARNVLVSKGIDEGHLIKLFDLSIPAEFAYYVLCLPQAIIRPEVESFVKWLTAECQAETIVRR
jgi:LysR family glycine cleavage system transcriptional activator